MVSSAPKLTSKTAATPIESSQPLRFRYSFGKDDATAGAAMATMGTRPLTSLRNAGVSSMGNRASCVQALRHCPQPMHRP